MTFEIWRGLVAACSSAIAGGEGGDFNEHDIERIEMSVEWLQSIGIKNGYYVKLQKEADSE